MIRMRNPFSVALVLMLVRAWVFHLFGDCAIDILYIKHDQASEDRAIPIAIDNLEWSISDPALPITDIKIVRVSYTYRNGDTTKIARNIYTNKDRTVFSRRTGIPISILRRKTAWLDTQNESVFLLKVGEKPE